MAFDSGKSHWSSNCSTKTKAIMTHGRLWPEEEKEEEEEEKEEEEEREERQEEVRC